MKTRFFFVVLFLLILMTPALVVYGQAGPKKPRTIDDYLPATLRNLSVLQPDNVIREPSYKEARVIVHADMFPSRVKVVYDGTKRPLPDTKKYVVVEWANKFAGAPEFYTAPYETEMLFVENGVSYWLAVRKEFIPQFDQELKKGDTLELFVIKLGSARDGDELAPVLLVEKFLKQ